MQAKHAKSGRRPLRRLLSVLLAAGLAAGCIQSTLAEEPAGGSDQTANADISMTAGLYYTLKSSGTEQPLIPSADGAYSVGDITKVQSFRANYQFEIADPDGDPSRRTVHQGDYLLLRVPDCVEVPEDTGGTVPGNGNRSIADYRFIQDSGKRYIQVVFSEYVDDLRENAIHGGLEFSFVINTDGVNDGQNATVEIPLTGDTVIRLDFTKPAPPPTTPVTLTKGVQSYDQTTRTLKWRVRIAPATGKFEGCTFSDTIDTANLVLQSVSHGPDELGTGDYDYDEAGGKLSYTIPAGRNGVAYSDITVVTKIKSSVYQSLEPTSITNQALLTGGSEDVSLTSNQAAQTVQPEWLKKSGSVIEGNRIQWKLTANTTRQPMFDAVITDNLQADVTMDTDSLKVDGVPVRVYTDAGYSPGGKAEMYALLLPAPTGAGGSTLSVYLPRGQENSSTAERIVTFDTDVTPPDTAPTGANPQYNNTASMTARFIGDDGTGVGAPNVNLEQVGVGVPCVTVDKAHLNLTDDDRRDGTVTWKIAAASNLSAYGKSVIVDELPENGGLSYADGGVYWIEGSRVLNDSTEPKAEISQDGRTLTITFSTEQALAKQQHFTVKTQIDPDIYGTNLKNYPLTNSARAELRSQGAGDTVLASASDTDSITVSNPVITKGTANYTGNSGKQSVNPRVSFTLAINGNRMPLKNVTVTDDLNRAVTSFRAEGKTAFEPVPGVKWTYVPGSLVIQRTAGSGDAAALTEEKLAAIASAAAYSQEDNRLTVGFGKDTAVNDAYLLTFTAELDITSSEVFKENGTIRCGGNVAAITGANLKGTIESDPAGAKDLENKVLGKTGTLDAAAGQVIWTVRLNQRGIGLEGLQNPRFVDVLPAGLSLDPTSLRLYDGVVGGDGNFIPDSALDSAQVVSPLDYSYAPDPEAGEGRYRLTVSLPQNEHAYILRFATDVASSLFGTEISNSAFYEGETGAINNSTSPSMRLFNSVSGGSTTKTSATVTKKSKDTGAVVNAPATFELYWKDGTEWVFVRSLTTTDGCVTFWGLTIGARYAVKEARAPDGFRLDDDSLHEFDAAGDAVQNDMVFSNTPVKTGSWTPAAVKQLSGKAIARDFRFVLENGDGDALMNGVTEDPQPDGRAAVQFSLNDGVAGEGLLNFTDSHAFDESEKAGTEVLVKTVSLTLRELSEEWDGYTFDKSEKPLTVEVYNVKGRASLKVLVKDGDGRVLTDDNGRFTTEGMPVFRNAYAAVGGTTISGFKRLEGQVLTEGRFGFELQRTDSSGSAVGLPLTARNAADGSFSFALEFDETDAGKTYDYRVTEIDEGKLGYTYDGTVYRVAVTVTDNDDGTLDVSQHLAEPAGEDKIVFENAYTAARLNVKKVLRGRALESGQFTFVLSRADADGMATEELERAANKADGTAAFADLTYSKADIGKTFFYRVEEDASLLRSGYTYDDTVYTVTVRVADDGSGRPVAQVSAEAMGGDGKSVPADALIFTNDYTARGSLALTAKKVLNGRALADGEFAFILSAADGTRLQTVKNRADGSVAFAPLAFTQEGVGTYRYRIAEMADGAPGIVYDSAVYVVTVTVTDNGDGTLAFSAVTEKEEDGRVVPAERIEFVNRFASIVNNGVQGAVNANGSGNSASAPPTGEGWPAFPWLPAVPALVLVFARRRKRAGAQGL